MTQKRTDPEAMRELGRRGGLASAESRRKRKARAWFDAELEYATANGDDFVRSVNESRNAMAKVKLLELAQQAKAAQLVVREHGLEQREAEVAQREREVGSTADWLEMASRKRARLLAEAEGLERQRDELRLAIERDAAAHDYEYVEDDEDALAEA